MSVVGGQPKKHASPSYKATKHIESTFHLSLLLVCKMITVSKWKRLSLIH